MVQGDSGGVCHDAIGCARQKVQSAPVLGFNGRVLGTFVTASLRPGHSFDQDMAGFGIYAVRTIIQKQLQLS